MPQRINESVQNSFIKGLITERGELTFPEDASTDELNCDLLKTGARRRRLALAQEGGGTLSTETNGTGSTVFTVNRWRNVGEQANVEFIVVQFGNEIHFYNLGGGTVSNERVDTTFTSGVEYALDLNTFAKPTGVGVGVAPIQVTSIKGALIVSSPEINTFYITRNVDTGAFTETEISFRVRDYAWQGDLTTYDEESATSTPGAGRIYDTQNAGWADGPNDVGASALTTYRGASSNKYPPLTHPWYSGKNSSGTFSVTEWEKVFSGNSLITNGHYVYDLYEKDRLTVSGVAADTSTEDARFTTVAAYAGRVFYSGMDGSTDDNGSKVFFSQLITQGFEKIGDCFQQNDPTSEELSDLLDTDGGFVSIPEAHQIRKLHTFGPDLYVFAANGVWKVSGVDDVFRATEYSVSKISEDGIIDEGSFVSASGRPYWWSNEGIFTVGTDQVGNMQAQNISVSTIQTFFENINAAERAKVRGIYDEVNRRVFWAYPSNGETVENKLNEILIWDEVLQAFFPWSVADEDADTSYMVGLSFTNGIGSATVTFNVITNGGDNVQDSSANDVVSNSVGASLSSAQIKVLYLDSTGAVGFADFNDTSFLDWGTANYSSYAETAFNFMGGAMAKKTAPYILVFMKTTETGWSVNDAVDGYDPVRPSSLKMSSKWDFRTNPNSAAQQCYRLKYPTIVDAADLGTWSYPESVVQTRLKVRGKGRVMVLRWESEEGKDFHLLGWSLLGGMNSGV